MLFKEGASETGRGILARILAGVRAFFRKPAAAAEPGPEPGTERLTGREAVTGRSSEPSETASDQTGPAATGIPGEGHAATTEIRDEGDAGAKVSPAGTRPAAGSLQRATLQILPGRLVPVHPDVIRQEIRFLKPSNREREVTLGRAEDDPPDHVTIDHPSLESLHATMRYERGDWSIESRSGDRPVLLNGQALGPEVGPRHLKDGDRIRLGDIDFDYRVT